MIDGVRLRLETERTMREFGAPVSVGYLCGLKNCYARKKLCVKAYGMKISVCPCSIPVFFSSSLTSRLLRLRTNTMVRMIASTNAAAPAMEAPAIKVGDKPCIVVGVELGFAITFTKECGVTIVCPKERGSVRA